MRGDPLNSLVLAAGASTRMGRPKAALPFGETTALGLILAACRDAAVPAIVVAGADEPAVREAAAPFAGATVVVNAAWATGRTGSIVGLSSSGGPSCSKKSLCPSGLISPFTRSHVPPLLKCTQAAHRSSNVVDCGV